MKKYNSPKIEVTELRNMAILAGSLEISTTPVNPSTALSKEFDFDEEEAEW